LERFARSPRARWWRPGILVRRLGLSDTVFVGDTEDIARAFWLRPPDISNPVVVSANGTEPGDFSVSTGSTLQLHIDDALVLGSDFDTLTFPTSIVARAGTLAVPAVSPIGLVLMALLFLGTGLLYRTARGKKPRLVGSTRD
jgi:hypothetical protein